MVWLVFQYRPEPYNTPGIIMSHELGVGAGIAQYLRRLDYGLLDLSVVIQFLPGPRDFSLFQNVLAGFVAPPPPPQPPIQYVPGVLSP